MARKTLASTLAQLPARSLRGGRGRLGKRKAEQARRDFNVWAWEQNRQGRQARVGTA